MHFVYKPEGAEPQRWEFDPDKLMSPEAEAIERHTGMDYSEWARRVGSGSMLALHGLLFVMLKRTEPTLRWDQVVFSIGDVDFELTDEETREARDRLRAKAATEGLNPAEAETLENFEAQVDDVVDDLPATAAVEDEDPKADLVALTD